MDTNSSRLRVLGRPRPKRKNRLVTFASHLKDWGGVGLFILALFYTFPTNLAKDIFFLTETRAKIASTRLAESREVLRKILSLMLEKLEKLDRYRGGDPAILNQIDITYNGLFYNIIQSNIDLLKSTADMMTSAELYPIGSALVYGGELETGVELLRRALARSKLEPKTKTGSTIRRELGLSLFLQNSEGLREEARKLFTEALEIHWNEAGGDYSEDYDKKLVELGDSEVRSGNIECGLVLMSQALRRLEIGSLQSPSARVAAQIFRSNLSTFPHGLFTEGENECSYLISGVAIR